MSIISITEGQFSNALSAADDPFNNANSIDSQSEDVLEWSSSINTIQTCQQQATQDVSTITRDFSLDTASTLDSTDTFLGSPIASNPGPAKMTSKEEMYRHLQEQVQRDYFVTWKMPKSREYTSAFVDPISRELFLSGDLVQYSTRKKEGLVWYKVAGEAEEAAAARALDCFDLRNKTRRIEGQRVEESPYLVGNEPPIPSLICPEVMRRLEMVCKPQKLDPIGSLVTTFPVACDERVQLTKATSPKPWDSSVHPIQALVKFYNGNRPFFARTKGIVVPTTNYIWWTNFDNLHTCAFVCPVFGDIFLAGKLIHTSDGRSLQKGGLNWYGAKREAQKAAAGHAHDCLSRKKTRMEDAHQFCCEISSPEGIKSFDDIVQLVPPEQMKQIQDLRSRLQQG